MFSGGRSKFYMTLGGGVGGVVMKKFTNARCFIQQILQKGLPIFRVVRVLWPLVSILRARPHWVPEVLKVELKGIMYDG